MELLPAFLFLGAATAGFLVWRFRRRHRGVPRGWQTAQSPAADLHRRVHRCIDRSRREVAHAATRGAPVDKLMILVDDLELQARAIDAQLVTASRLPGQHRERALHDIRFRIIETEKLAVRLDALAAELTGPTLGAADAGLRDLRERFDALDAARDEAHRLADGRPEPEAPPEARPGTG